MRKKTSNAFFTFIYPGLPQQSTASSYELKDLPCVAIAKDGEFVSISGGRYGGEKPSAVFYTVTDLSALRDALDEVIDLYQTAILKAKAQS